MSLTSRCARQCTPTGVATRGAAAAKQSTCSHDHRIQFALRARALCREHWLRTACAHSIWTNVRTAVQRAQTHSVVQRCRSARVGKARDAAFETPLVICALAATNAREQTLLLLCYPAGRSAVCSVVTASSGIAERSRRRDMMRTCGRPGVATPCVARPATRCACSSMLSLPRAGRALCTRRSRRGWL